MQASPSVEHSPSEYPASDGRSHRQSASALTLVREAAGGPAAWAGKLRRLVRTLAVLGSAREVQRRVDRLLAQGVIEDGLTPVQRLVLGLDMLRYFIEPGARDYYETRGIDFSLHQLLRVLDDPVSMVDPVGIFSERDTIIGHVLQVVHANPIYDLQLLEMFEDGLEEMEAQTAAMVAGTHPRSGTIGAIVEDPEYHARLLAYVRAYRRDPSAPELRRRAGSARESEAFVLAEETFGAMTSAFRYGAKLPKTLGGAIAHLREKTTIDPSLCEAEKVRAVRARFSGA